MLDALRAWAADPDTGSVLTSDRYRAWARDGDRGVPMDPAITDRFGGWRRALDAAGLEHHEDVRDRFKRLDPDAFENALRGFAAAYPDPDLRSAYRYAAWRAGRAPWAPSKRTLTLRLGSWPKVRDRLRELDAEQPAEGPPGRG